MIEGISSPPTITPKNSHASLIVVFDANSFSVANIRSCHQKCFEPCIKAVNWTL
ncbi:hypothetical protein X947_5807 [Burkholderia pseudomallei MSHR7334]|nr:hypothetical protein X947_5807 [Burkholderia pseudomallei MSHR7334]